MQDLSKMSTEELLRMRQQRQGTFVPSPTAPYEGPKAAADTRNATVQANVNAATAPATVATASLPPNMRWVDPNDPSRGMTPIQVVGAPEQQTERSATIIADAEKGYNSTLLLDRLIADMETRFKEGPGKTKGVLGVKDFLPLTENQRFTSAGQSSFAAIRDVLAFTGTELNRPEEVQRAIGPYLPEAGDRDELILDKFERLKELRDTGLRRTVNQIGGIPDGRGGVIRVPEGLNPTPDIIREAVRRYQDPNNERRIWPEPSMERGSALEQTYLTRSGNEAAGQGADVEGELVPKEYQAEIDKFFSSGGFTPELYATTRMGLDVKYGRNSTQDDYYRYLEDGFLLSEKMKSGGTIDTKVPPTPREMSGWDQFVNNNASDPEFTAGVNLVDATLGGPISYFLRDEMEAGNALNPKSALGGQVGGAVAGTTLLGKAGQLGVRGADYALNAVSPKTINLASNLLQQGGKAQFGRNVAADAVYGTAYGTNTGMDVSDAALASTVGSFGGNTLGKIVSKTVTGVPVRQSIKDMRAAGVEPTVGQTLGGGFKRAEEKALSVPLVGDMIARRYDDGRQAFNAGAYRIGAGNAGTINDVGPEALNKLRGITSNAYKPLDNMTLDVAGSPMAPDLMAAGVAARSIPKVGDDAADTIAYQVGEGVDTSGMMGGRDWQDAYRGLGREGRVRASGDNGFAYNQAMRNAQDVLAQGLEVQNPGAYGDFLSANAVNRRMNVLADAQNAAKNQDQQLFTPKQLMTADANNATRLTGRVNSASGNSPFADYARSGVDALSNNTPNSGTADRALQFGVGATLLGGGSAAGEQYFTGGTDLTQTGTGVTAGALALALLGGSRGGQRLLNKVISRPDLIQKAADELAQNGAYRRLGGIGGIFGSAGVPLAIESTR